MCALISNMVIWISIAATSLYWSKMLSWTGSTKAPLHMYYVRYPSVQANRRRSTCHQLPHSGSLTHHHSSHIATITEETTSQAEQGEGEQGEGIQRSATSSRATAQLSESGSQMGQTEEEEEEARMVLIPCLPAIRTAPPDIQLAREEGKMGWVKFVLKWFLFVLSFPFVVAFTWTIPNCSENRKWYRVVGSFLMSIVWIAIISFAMVTIVARVGCILQIGEFTMGLVVVAIGTSVPVSCSKMMIRLVACSLCA